MQSFIVLSRDKNLRINYCLDYCRKKGINDLDITFIDEKASLGISDIRNLQKTLIYKPLRSKLKALILASADNLTTEAQNAMLKTLEEPTNDTIILLTASSSEGLLPTVISRCRVIGLDKSGSQKQEEEKLDIKQLLFSNINLKLKTAQDATRDRETSEKFLTDAILALRRELIKGNNEKGNGIAPESYLEMINSFQKALLKVKTTNANARLIIENLLLSS